MIIEKWTKIAKIDKDIKRLKKHKFTQEEQNKISNIVEETNKKIDIDNFIKELKTILNEG